MVEESKSKSKEKEAIPDEQCAKPFSPGLPSLGFGFILWAFRYLGLWPFIILKADLRRYERIRSTPATKKIQKRAEARDKLFTSVSS